MSNQGMGMGVSGLGNTLGIAPGHASNGGQSGLANQSLYQQQMGLAQHAAAQQYAWNSIHARTAQADKPKWVVDGKSMTFQEFVEAVFPEDSPQKTFFLLKHAK